jgi:hypothetical protein
LRGLVPQVEVDTEVLSSSTSSSCSIQQQHQGVTCMVCCGGVIHAAVHAAVVHQEGVSWQCKRPAACIGWAAMFQQLLTCSLGLAGHGAAGHTPHDGGPFAHLPILYQLIKYCFVCGHGHRSVQQRTWRSVMDRCCTHRSQDANLVCFRLQDAFQAHSGASASTDTHRAVCMLG